MQLPLTLRVVFYSIRATIRAGLVFFCAWLLLIPANSEEVRTLGAVEGTRYPLGLRPMRTARFIVAWAPQPAYTMVAAILGPEASPLIVKTGMAYIAAGNVLPKSARVTPSTNSDRDIDGPRFIRVD